jgi:superfamily II DNA or RNA helicase
MSIDLIENIFKYPNIEEYLESLKDVDDKGKIFEVFAKNFFLCDERLSHRVKNVWLLSEIPTNIIKKLNIPLKDKGIDLIIETNDNTFIAVQVKYRSNINKVLTFTELSTFLALSSSTKFEYRILFTNTLQTCKDLLNFEKIICYTHNTIINSNLFLTNLQKLISPNKCIVEFNKLELRKYQSMAILETFNKFKENNKRLKLIMSPGTGKTLTSLKIYEHMLKLYVNSEEYNKDCINHTLIFVCPYLSLVNQTFKEYFTHLRINKSFFKVLCVASESENNEHIDHVLTTNVENIVEFIATEGCLKIIFCTFASCNRLVDAINETNKVIDLCFVDEAHRTVNNSHTSSLLTECKLIKRFLFLTGTEKIFTNKNSISIDDENVIYSKCMKNKEIYGDYSYQYGLREAIDDGYLCDYRVKIITSFESLLNKKDVLYLRELDIKANIDIINVCLMLLDAFKKGEINKTIVFFNRKLEALISSQIFEYLLEKEKIKDVEVFNLTDKNRNKCLRDYKNSTRAVIFNVQILRLGFDDRSCDSVFFYSDMNSKIDVIQSICRSLRLYDGKCIATIMLPIVLENIEDLDTITKFENVRNVILALSSEDEVMCEYIADENKDKKKNKRIIFEVCGLNETNKKKNKDQEREDIIIKRISKINAKIEFNIFKSCEIGDVLWMKKYNKTKEWLERFGKYPSRRSDDKKESSYSKWISNQKVNYKKNKLPQTKIVLLETFDGWVWKKETQWMKKYKYVKNYIKENNKYPTSGSKKKKEDTYGKWVQLQRLSYKKNKLSKTRIKYLEKLDQWSWNFKEDEWDKRYNEMKVFVDENNKYPTTESKIKEHKSLANWMFDQRKYYKQNKMSQERIDALEAINRWNWSKDDDWMVKYKWVKNYVKENNKFPAKDSKENEIKTHGAWVLGQRGRYKINKLSEEKIKLLEALPNWFWVFDTETQWTERYEWIKNHIKKNNYPSAKSNNNNERVHGDWISKQRVSFRKNKLLKERIIFLESLKNWKWEGKFN